MLKPVCFIAARGGSKGVPNKNIKIIHGKPLIAHAIDIALRSKLFSHVIVSTDSKKIKDIADKHSLNVIYDAAHAFGVEKNGKSILNEGDLLILNTSKRHQTNVQHHPKIQRDSNNTSKEGPRRQS